MPLFPAFKENNVAVVFSCNNNFLPFFSIAFESIIENVSKNYNYDIILLGRNVKIAKFEKIAMQCEGLNNVVVRYFDMSDIINTVPEGVFITEGYVPIDTYNKFFLSEIMKGYKKCVYLDTDIVVLDDIAKLFNIDLHDKSIAASINVANVFFALENKEYKGVNLQKYITQTLKINDVAKYFQAGVMLFNLKKLAAHNYLNRCLKKLSEIGKPLYFDQCVMNALFYEDIAYFSTSWNHVWYFKNFLFLKKSLPNDIYQDYANGRETPKIIHYAGENKPNYNPCWQLSEYFWRYAKKTPFYQTIIDEVTKGYNIKEYEEFISVVNRC